tara:strand:- start:1873 stop:2865 length:993 start_codon:yes stop_codon:yes gene_type:complete
LSEVTEQYILRTPYFNDTCLEISKADFIRYQHARNVILALRQISLSYAIAAVSYVELEKLFSDFALKYSVGDFDSRAFRTFSDEFTELCSLRLLTLLNSYSAFLDQTPKRLKSLGNALPEASIDFKSQCSSHYDQNPDYRLFSCLRNYSQHHQLPITGSSFGERPNLENEDNIEESKRRDEIGVHPYISLAKIKSEKSTKAKDKQLLNEIGLERGDVKAIVRSIASSLAEINHWLVQYTEKAFSEAEAVTKESLGRIENAQKSAVSSVEVAMIAQDHEEAFSMVVDIVAELRKERRRWHGIRASWRRSISGRSVQNKDTYFGSREKLWVS